MTGFQLPDKLRQHRPLLLALEAIGWLHMTGKAKVDFLLWHGGQKDNYDYKAWYERETPPFPWDDLLKWVRDKYSDDVVWPQTLTEFITKHADGKSHGNLVGLLQAGHAMASGIEKQSFPQRTVEYLGQDATHMWLSTAFGHPERNLLADPPELLTEAGWKRLLGQIKGLLAELQRYGINASATSIEDWWQWREKAVGPGNWLCKAFSSTLAETRLPNNDVTLFDQSYVAAALFKSAVAGAILEDNGFPWDKPLKQQTRWRLLTIGIGADYYEARAVKIGDWTGARLALDEFFTRVRKLIEVDLAVGSLLYKDGEVCVFSFPGERTEEEVKRDILKVDNWKQWLADRIDGLAKKVDDCPYACDTNLNLEMPPYCNISEPSRSLVGMTMEIETARKTMAVPLHRDWEIPEREKKETKGHVCPVCLVRRNGDITSKQKRCEECYDRRDKRCKKWLEGKLGSDSIWISEVADANDRVALVTMSLDIEPWLDGTRLDALRTQSVAKWAAQNTTTKKPLPEDHDSLVSLLKTALGTGNQASQARSLVQKKIAPGLKDENGNNVPWDKFYSLMVEDRAKAPKWEDLDENGRAGWLTHQLFCKLASPGRIYRFWRQAEEFFEALLVEFREIAAADQNRWRVRRLLLKTDGKYWKDGDPYSGRFNDKPFDLLYQKDGGGFITISNLSRILEETQGKEHLKSDKPIPLKDDDNNSVELLMINTVEDAPGHLGVYHPLIPLELSPVRFRVLLPLEAASECVDRAIERWKEQFARVWDRLPLRVGVVAFPRMTPFQAVIEAARNIEDDLRKVKDKDGVKENEPETWRVSGCETRDGVTALCIKSLNHPHELLQTIPIRLPDGRDDVFYPYLAVEDKQVRFPLDFQHPTKGQVFRHAKDLRSGDGIFVYPPFIATVFMDDTAKRFEAVKRRQLMEWRRMQDIWRLIEGIRSSQSALRGAWFELVERRDAWQGPNRTWLEGGQEAWLDLVRAVFRERLRARGACLETLVQAARDGLLDWSLEWHMSVLKKQVSGGDR